MKHLIKNVGVDAGLIMVGDTSYFTTMFPNEQIFPNRLAQVISVTPGQYKVDWSIKNTWNGNINGTFNLNVTSGQVFISDPCYLIEDQKTWCKYLDDTEFCEKLPGNAAIINEMGGDGSYDVSLNFCKGVDHVSNISI